MVENQRNNFLMKRIETGIVSFRELLCVLLSFQVTCPIQPLAGRQIMKQEKWKRKKE